ncbi:hypothetical protein [Paenibacillus sp. MER 99-2]|uniref:hypothetical protein n=1 Tax=Paenibacillus sp. MER 99-2 TaxID=2939572 RepID=UPI00203EDCEB|nr:hypothetical protein [Paenibacillus sp. MER 99-2]MCM3174164.1 hypothetical protein [Paenibacillus sp. MER 99-2]
MDDLIAELELLNSNIISELSDANYEELVEYVDKRGIIIQRIQDHLHNVSIDSAQKARIVALTDHDAAILSQMNLLRVEAQDWLMKRNQAKAQRNAYESDFSPESILMDRKK